MILSIDLPKTWVKYFKKWAMSHDVLWVDFSWTEMICDYGCIIEQKTQTEKNIWLIKNSQVYLNLASTKQIVIMNPILPAELLEGFKKKEHAYVADALLSFLISMASGKNTISALSKSCMLCQSYWSMAKQYKKAKQAGFRLITDHTSEKRGLFWCANEQQNSRVWWESTIGKTGKVAKKEFFKYCCFALVIKDKIIWSGKIAVKMPKKSMEKSIKVFCRSMSLVMVEMAFFYHKHKKQWLFVYATPSPHFQKVWGKKKKEIFELLLVQGMEKKEFKSKKIKACFIPERMRPKVGP